jgi:hypothetical protein
MKLTNLKQSALDSALFHAYAIGYKKGYKKGFKKADTPTLLREEEARVTALTNIRRKK